VIDEKLRALINQLAVEEGSEPAPIVDQIMPGMVCPEQELIYRRWARENYRADIAISERWHPIVREEWQRIAAGG
jgi:hypothetical protein